MTEILQPPKPDYRVWEQICKVLTPLQRVRIRRRVVNERWGLRKAIEAEGVMWVGSNLDAAEGWLRGL